MMMKQQSGFTLIELIMVIVVLAALAVTAIPRYVDLQTQAEIAALEGVAGSLGAGAATNLAQCIIDTTATNCLSSGAPTTGVLNTEMDNCDDVEGTLLGGLPTGYTITAAAMTATTIGETTSCILTGPGGQTRNFNALATP